MKNHLLLLQAQAGNGQDVQNSIHDVSISIEQGEFVAVIGTSGSGKSTLLNMLGGLDRSSFGSVRVDKFELGKLKEEELTVFRRRRSAAACGDCKSISRKICDYPRG